MRPNFELISEVLPVQRRDFALAVTDLLNPLNANPLVDGEFLSLNASYQLVRGSGILATPGWAVFAERGRYDTQAIGKTVVLFNGGYEAETRICDVTGLSVGDPLMVSDVTVDSLTKQGLLAATTGERRIFGHVTRLPGNGRVRFWTSGAQPVQSVP
jgi:hypothetical protein